MNDNLCHKLSEIANHFNTFIDYIYETDFIRGPLKKMEKKQSLIFTFR